MAHFRGTVRGSREMVSRLGGKGSGIVAQANGWSIGGVVTATHNEESGEDEITFRLTGGSSPNHDGVTIGTFTRKDLERLVKKQQAKRA